MKYKKVKKMLALTLAGTMVLSNGALTTMAKQNDDYTDANLKNDGGVGGMVFGENGSIKNADGSAVKFNTQTDYVDDTFKQSDEVQLETTTYEDAYDKGDMESMTGDKLEETLDALIASMTYDEKIHMVSMNSDPEKRDGVGYMTGIPRLGVPETRMHDGPSGVSTSTSDADTYVETTNFPLELVASQTWSEDAMQKYGEALGREQVSIGSGWQLGMQMDLSRTTHWARSKDSLGEDYLLAAILATAQTKGIQSQGGIPMAKHIGAYSTDGDTSLWVRVNEQTLHTAYLYPFEKAAKEANLASIMGTYNRLNGYYVSSNYYLQVEVLRDMWNWEGSMVPDWGADKEEISMILGTDISQSSAGNIDKAFRSAVAQGYLTMEDLDTAARHALYSLGVSGYLNQVELDGKGYVKQDTSRAVKDEFGQWSSDYNNITESRIKFVRTYDEDKEDGLYEEDNEVAKEIAEKGIVLLKNENDALPLKEEDYTGDNSVAYIGYGATNLIGGTGGERSFGVLQYMTTPLESTKDIVGEDANVNGYILDDIHGVSISNVYTDEEMTLKGWTMTDKIVEGDLSSGGGGFPGGPGGAGGSAAQSGEDTDKAVTLSDESESEETSSDETVTASVVDDVHLVTTTNGRSFKNDETGNALEDGAEAEWIGYIEAPSDGNYKFVIQTNGGGAKVKIEGLNDDVSSSAKASDGVSWDYYTTEGLNYQTASANLKAGNKYKIIVSAQQSSSYRDQGVKLSWITPSKAEEDLDAALEAASKPNTKVVMFTRTGATGHGPVFQTDYDLSLDELDEIKKVQAAAKAAGNKFVLVTFGRSGYSFEGDWLDDTDALVCPFYAGQAAGTALAEILTGKVNPSGKLTVSLPKTNNDTLLTYGYYDKDSTSGNNYNKYRAGDQSQKSYTAHYEEGLNIGYKWYDSEDGAEYQYPFGYGLSYTDFEYSNMDVRDNGDFTYTVTVDVTNTGSVEGDDVVQLYIDDGAEVPSNVQVAEKQLVAFERVENIEPGETKTATMTVEKRMLSYWDDSIELTERADGTKDKWIVADGTRTLMAGGASDDLTLKESITIAEENVDLTGIDNALAAVPEDLSVYKNTETLEAIIKAAEAIRDYAKLTNATEEKQGVVNSIAASLKDAIAALTNDSEVKDPADVSKLTEVLAAVPEDLTIYTDETAETVKNLAEAAEALLARTDLTEDDQDSIDSLTEALSAAITALEKKDSSAEDITGAGLDRLIALIEKQDSMQYTKESWSKVKEALATAKEVRANENATSKDLDKATSDLLTAFKNLESAVEKLHLQTAVDVANELLQQANNYKGDAKALAEAVEAAQAVLDNEEATQDEVDTAARSVLAALEKLVKKADVTSLENLIKAAENLSDGNYTQSTLEALSDAIEAAKEVVNDANRENTAISKAYSDIITAIENLERKGNKAALQAMITKAEEILDDQNSYTASTIEGLENVLAEAKQVYADDNAVQKAVDTAVKTLTLKVADARLKGDVNGDGEVTTSDSAELLKYAAELSELDDAASESADVNEDGSVDTNDAAQIMQYAAEKIASF